MLGDRAGDLLALTFHPGQAGAAQLLRRLGELVHVVAQVFVAEAARDLKVAVEARHHQQLLVDLGRLWQRIKLPGVHARRHEIVARAFGRGLGEDRRLDLEKLELGEGATGALQQPVPQRQIALHFGPAQIEVTVLEAQLLGGELFTLAARHRNRRGGRPPPDPPPRRLGPHPPRPRPPGFFFSPPPPGGPPHPPFPPPPPSPRPPPPPP